MKMPRTEYKAVNASAHHVTDDGDGVITAFVSVTGIKDNVDDVIMPGAYEETLRKRLPKGVWSHKWDKPISKTLEATELPPGHEDLPKTMSDGTPWPAEAGALKIKMQFNLKSPRGRQAYTDVSFFGDQQEWSIGYKVPKGGSTQTKTGLRQIHKLDLYEFSPVLFGAMTHARTVSVKSAQLAYKSLDGVDTTEILVGYAALMVELKEFLEGDPAVDATDDFVGDDTEEMDVELDDEVEESDVDDEIEEDDEEYDEEDEDDDDGPDGRPSSKGYDYEDDGEDEDGEYESDEFDEGDEEYDDEEDDEEQEKALFREAISTLEELERQVFGNVVGEKSLVDTELVEAGRRIYIEAKAIEFDSVCEAIDAMDLPVTKTDALALKAAGEAFDSSAESGDPDGMGEAATEIMNILEIIAEDSDDETKEAAAVVARTIADKMYAPEDAPEDDDEEGEKVIFTADDGFQYKNLDFSHRAYGAPVNLDDDTMPAGEYGIKAFIGGLDSWDIAALSSYMEEKDDDYLVMDLVEEEYEKRVELGELEEKGRVVRDSAYWGLPPGTPIKAGMKPRGGKHGSHGRIGITRQGNRVAKPTSSKGSGGKARSGPVKPDIPVKKAATKKPTAAVKKAATRAKLTGREHETPLSPRLQASIDNRQTTLEHLTGAYNASGGTLPLTRIIHHLRTGRIDADEAARRVASNPRLKNVSAALTDELRRVKKPKAGGMVSHSEVGQRAMKLRTAHGMEHDAAIDYARDMFRDEGRTEFQFDPAATSRLLDRAASREEAHNHLASLTRAQLDELSKHIGMPLRGRNKDEHRRNLVEFTTGGRLDHQALMRHFDNEGGIHGGERRRPPRGAYDPVAHQAEIEGMVADRRHQWGRYTPAERRNAIRDEIRRHPIMGRALDQPDRKTPKTIAAHEAELRRQFEHASSWHMGVVTPEEYEAEFHNLRARRQRAASRPEHDLSAVQHPAGSARRRRSLMDRLRGKGEDLEGVENKRDFTAQQRRDAADAGHAESDGSFPIENRTDLKNAIKLARDPEDRKHICKRARALGLESMLPDSWDEKTATYEVVELKGLDEMMALIADL